MGSASSQVQVSQINPLVSHPLDPVSGKVQTATSWKFDSILSNLLPIPGIPVGSNQGPPPDLPPSSFLRGGSVLAVGEKLVQFANTRNPSGQGFAPGSLVKTFQFTLDPRGALVVIHYVANGDPTDPVVQSVVKWQSPTLFEQPLPESEWLDLVASFTSGGDLVVLYKGEQQWSSFSGGRGAGAPYSLYMTNTGSAVIIDHEKTVVWSTNTDVIKPVDLSVSVFSNNGNNLPPLS